MVDSHPMVDDVSHILSADLVDDADLVIEGTLRPRTLERIHRPARGQGQPVGPADGGPGRGEAADHVLLYGPPGPWQDHPGHDHRPRTGGQRQVRLRARDRARRGSRGHPHLARGTRRPVHRRDPPPEPGRGGDPLPGDGGLRAGRDDRQGTVGPEPAPRASSRSRSSAPRRVRAGSVRRCGTAWRDVSAGLLLGAGAVGDCRSVGGDPRRERSSRPPPMPLPAAAGGRRES